jgi:hypothetical protein
MATKKGKKPVKYSGNVMANSKGKDVPVELIRPEDLRRDMTVERIFAKALKLSRQMAKEKSKIVSQMKKHADYLMKIAGIDPNSEKLYNMQLSSFDNLRRVIKKSSNVIEFDANIQLAEIKIKNCVKKWSVGANAALVQVVDNVFRTDKKGFLNKASILSLRTYNITDAEWKDALELIDKSIQITERKEYLIIQYRKDYNSEWETLPLNFSSIDEKFPEEAL